MKNSPIKTYIFLLATLIQSPVISAQFIDTTANRVKTPLSVDLEPIGTLIPRNTKDIKSSRITVGAETLDRDHTVWDNYKDYLPPLGVKKIRLQAGWAKTEKVKGEYDWEWLDEIIDYAIANHIEPWLQLSYGNPIYKGGGDINLLNSLMTSKEGYEAWDKWVAASVNRYKDRVNEWEIWNEPDLNGHIDPVAAAKLNIRTAEIIKNIQPNAEIAGLAMASNSDKDYLNTFLKTVSDAGKLDLFHWISYHSYTMPPEDAYSEGRVLGLRSVIEKYSKDLLLRQGENGAPSTYIPSFALSEYYWTEYTQAKYDMRRVLGDLGHNIETSVFTIIDIYYDWGDRAVLNTKGLIESDVTMAAIRPKVAYYTIQNIASIFDDSLILDQEFDYQTDFQESLSVYGYKKNSKSLVTVWKDGENVTNSFETSKVRLELKNVIFKNPVWVDLMTGRVYKIKTDDWSSTGNTTIVNIPVYDAPVLIVEKSLLKFKNSI